MHTYRLNNGTVVTTNLTAQEMCKRATRLDSLRVITEGYEEGVGRGICEKALRAYDKNEGFTGIIRLTAIEKDFLDYIYNENPFLTDWEIEALEYYLGIRK